MTQERTAAPSRCTVQAPHCAMPHPYLVPVRPACSRIAHNSGVLGSTLRSTVFPLIVNRAMASSRNRAAWGTALLRNLDQGHRVYEAVGQHEVTVPRH